VRFVLVDRIVGLTPGQAIQALKNVSASEDVFDEHFPGWPIFPGAMLVEVFEQAAQLLIGATYRFERAGRLTRISRVSFRRLVRPGDQLAVQCERRRNDLESSGAALPGEGAPWTIVASASVDGTTVATGTLEFVADDVRAGRDVLEIAERYREMARVLEADPVYSPVQSSSIEARR
jgi:3-hydroxyacyl-[acyl-carrier-protein] dehydratase